MTRGCLAALTVFLCCTLANAEPTKDGSAWWSHIKVLASDDLQGRLTGSPGYRKAAEYVAAQFKHDGLEPAGANGYLQEVGLDVQTIDTARSSVHLVPAAGGAAQDVTAEVVIAPGVLQRGETRAPLLFGGYCIHLPDAGYDDFASLDVHGAVVVCLTGGPAALSGAQRAYAVSEALPHYLEQAGAVGVLRLTAPKNREVPWERQKAAGEQPGMLLAEKALRLYQGPMFSAAFYEGNADALLAGSGHSFGELTALADTHQPLPRFRLAATIDAHVETTTSTVTADNVVAEWPGSDPKLAAEAVVLTAHLDHLGTGKPDHGDGIFHGAMDDASGVASLLEIAHELHANHAKPRRSILFVAVCGEEKGLLGSRYFAAHPTRHAGRLVADINSDMFLPLYPLHRVVGYGADESSIGADVRAMAAALGVELVADPQPDHLVFVRSDQYSFVRKGIPAVMLSMAPRPGTADEEVQRQWFRERYHAQADDLGQPVDLGAADAFDRLVYRLALRVADAPSAPAWNGGSFFARFAQTPLP
jgi:Zn-dependent M28 family amino/carboxypeptidase